MKSTILFLVFSLFFLDGFGQIGFEQNIIVTDSDGANSVYPVDLDGDGDLDLAVSSHWWGRIGWYENLDGQGSFGIERIITNSASAARSVYAADLDGDGDMDLLSASALDDKIAWYENVDGLGNFGAQQIISTDANSAQAVFASDLDGDGDIDVLSASSSDDKIAWYENTDGLGTFSSEQIITTDAMSANSVFASDLDGDGDMDVLSASYNDDKVAWYENTDGQGSFSLPQIISLEGDGAYSVYAEDIDGDGDVDVLSASLYDDKVAWFENVDGQGNFGVQQIISLEADEANSVYAVDFDGDGDMDVLSSSNEDDKVAWYENIDGAGTFGTQQIITTNEVEVKSAYADDLDGDGDMDVLSVSTSLSYGEIHWYENEDGLGQFGAGNKLSKIARSAKSVFAADIDGDGDEDVLSASAQDDKIAWYDNRDGQGDFSNQIIITTDADGAFSVYATDLDGDGDMDVLSASYLDNKIAWYENLDGSGNFSAQQIISTDAEQAVNVYASDLDGDGDMDVLSASYLDSKIAWYENTDGQGTFGLQQIITTDAMGAQSVMTNDLDGDGDMDVLSASSDDDKIAWYENTDGQGNFGTQQIITTDAIGAQSVTTNDLDGDGDMDVLSASFEDGKIAWYKNTDGIGNFGAQVIISDYDLQAESVFSIDLDSDGDIDVLSASAYDDKIVWYENIDGQGTFAPEALITYNILEAESVYATDIDGDGDVDVLSASSDDSQIAWYKNCLLYTSDAADE